MLNVETKEVTNILALYDAKNVLVETIKYNDKSYIHIYHANNDCWYTLNYCAFETEENVEKLRDEIVGILNDYYDVESVTHKIE